MRGYLPIAVMALLAAEGCSLSEERVMRSDLRETRQVLRLEETGRAEFSPPESLPEKPALGDYLAYAALHNPALRAAYYRWAAAVEKAPQARALPNPTFSYSRYIREVETRVGPQKNRFALMQMVPWPTKLAGKSDQAVREALSRQYLYDAEKLALFFKVRQAYYEYYYLNRALLVVQDNLTLLQNLEGALRARYEAAAAASPALIRLQVELGKLEERQKSLAQLRPALAARLNAAIGRTPELELPWPENAPQELPALAEAELLAALQTENPGLKAARARIQAAAAGERVARAQYLPDVSLGASFIETDRRTDMNLPDNGKDPVMVTLELSLPVWWGKYAAGVREAKANRAAAESELQEKNNQLAADLSMAFFNYGDAARKLNLFEQTLAPKAQQALDASRTAFTAGQTPFSDLLDAERTLLELRLLAERARVDQAIRLAELEMLSGRELRQDVR